MIDVARPPKRREGRVSSLKPMSGLICTHCSGVSRNIGRRVLRSRNSTTFWIRPRTGSHAHVLLHITGNNTDFTKNNHEDINSTRMLHLYQYLQVFSHYV